MQQEKGQLLEEQLQQTKEQLNATEREKARVLDELREMKKVAQEARIRLKVSDVSTEINNLKELLNQELTVKERNIEALKVELGNMKEELGMKLGENKDASLNKLIEALSNVQSSDAHVLCLLSESKKRFYELEMEIEKGKELGTKMFDSFVAQTKELEQMKIWLQESKSEIKTLKEKMKSEEDKVSEFHHESKTSEVQLANEREKKLANEIDMLKNELKLATEAESNSKKAMDDLVLALKEVATESILVKEKLTSIELELHKSKSESEELKLNLRNVEERMEELKKEADLYKNTAERLRLEAEESVLAWSGKETCFVNCIKMVEEERDIAQRENKNLVETLREVENMNKTAKEENQKLRDILKQALNEANVAKEAAGIAREENSQLKDELLQKEEALNFISRENENFKMNEAAAMNNINELKRLLSEASTPIREDTKPEDKKLKKDNSMEREMNKDGKKLVNGFSFKIKEIKTLQNKEKDREQETKVQNKQSDNNNNSNNVSNNNVIDNEAVGNGETPKGDPLRGSIFDSTDSPEAPKIHQMKKSSSVCSADGETANLDDLDHLDGSLHFDDSDSEKNSSKKKALLRRFGDLLRGKAYYRKEAGVEQ